MTEDKERDDALIAEKRKLSNILEAITKLGTVGPWNDDLLRAAAILRGDERPKPDRLVEIFRALPLHGDAGCDKLTDDEWRLVAVAARTELHAEWEAERPAVVVPFGDDVIAAARFYADVPVAESRIVIMANAILDGAKGGE